MITPIKTLMAFSILAAAGSAMAQPPAIDGGAPTITVSYADLDMSSPAGLRTLNGRIHQAASTLCVGQAHKPLQTELAERRCMSAAIGSTKAGVEQAAAERSLHLAAQSKTPLPGQ